jgi:hypothetical protein
MMRRLLGAARRASTAPARPFRVLGLQQVAIGGLDKTRLSGLWEGLLGVPKIGRFVAEKENVDEDILLLGRGVAAVELDLMQPLDADKAPKVYSPPLNHIGLWVRLPHAPPVHTRKWRRAGLGCGGMGRGTVTAGGAGGGRDGGLGFGGLGASAGAAERTP